jgi:predicted transcriptional regulator
MASHAKMFKETRKKMIFDYLKGLKNPVNACHLAKKFDMTSKRIDQLMTELAQEDLVVKSKGIKNIQIPWKKTLVNYFEVKEEYKTFKPRKPKEKVLWHNPFGIRAA